jgi:hypothetical protein
MFSVAITLDLGMLALKVRYWLEGEVLRWWKTWWKTVGGRLLVKDFDGKLLPELSLLR